VHGWTAAALVALVLHIVMNQDRVMQEFERDRGGERILEPSTEGTGGRNTDAWAHHLAAPVRVIGNQVVEISPRLSSREVLLKRRSNDRPIFLERRRNEHTGGCRIRRVATDAHRIRRLTMPTAEPSCESIRVPVYRPTG
jgi:hypothetical protein